MLTGYIIRKTYFTLMEAVIAVFPLHGNLFLIPGIKDNSHNIDSAKVIESLKSKNQKLNDMNLGF